MSDFRILIIYNTISFIILYYLRYNIPFVSILYELLGNIIIITLITMSNNGKSLPSSEGRPFKETSSSLDVSIWKGIKLCGKLYECGQDLNV